MTLPEISKKIITYKNNIIYFLVTLAAPLSEEQTLSLVICLYWLCYLTDIIKLPYGSIQVGLSFITPEIFH